MTYSEAIDYLYSLRVFGMKFGLENTRALAEAMGNPQAGLRFIHVAGTNGKGSVCAMLESIYRAAELRVGLFTSPHLVAFAERIQVDRILISRSDIARLTAGLRATIQALGAETPPTFFEAVTVMALQYFKEENCDLVIWETGLGGRLDATNIVTPMASIITNIQLDHQKWLGHTLPEIAREKAGIIKPGIPVITGTEDAAALEVIMEVARQQKAPLIVETEPLRQYELGLKGEHQKKNAALALATVNALHPKIAVPESAIAEGFRTTRWDGRLQVVERPGGPMVLLDGAHNPAGARTLADALQTRFYGHRPALIIGTMVDKDYAAICKTLAPLADNIFATAVASERGAQPELLAEACRLAHPSAKIVVCPRVSEALAQTERERFVVVTGSLHFIGEAMEALGLAPEESEGGLNDYTTKASPGSIRAVTFDVGGTLIDPWPSVGHVYAEVAARHGIHAAPEELQARFIRAWLAKRDFGYSLAEWSDLVHQTFAGLIGGPVTDGLFSDLYSFFATAKPWRIFDDVRPCLEELKRRGVKLGVISNWDERLRPLLRELDLEKYFDAVVVSGEVGAHKPDPRIFQKALGLLQVPADATLHVGDSALEDAVGARSAGLQSLLLARGQSLADLASLEPLPALIT